MVTNMNFSQDARWLADQAAKLSGVKHEGRVSRRRLGPRSRIQLKLWRQGYEELVHLRVKRRRRILISITFGEQILKIKVREEENQTARRHPCATASLDRGWRRSSATAQDTEGSLGFRHQVLLKRLNFR